MSIFHPIEKRPQLYRLERLSYGYCNFKAGFKAAAMRKNVYDYIKKGPGAPKLRDEKHPDRKLPSAFLRWRSVNMSEKSIIT